MVLTGVTRHNVRSGLTPRSCNIGDEVKLAQWVRAQDCQSQNPGKPSTRKYTDLGYIDPQGVVMFCGGRWEVIKTSIYQ